MFHKLKRELGIRESDIQNKDIVISDKFWIDDNVFHQKEFERTDGNCCFNHQIGLPLRKIPPFTEMPLFDYEIDIINNIERHKDYLLNKARGIGATELILRLILFKAVHNKILGRKFLIVTGIRFELAKNYLRRMEDLCQNFHYTKTQSSIIINQ